MSKYVRLEYPVKGEFGKCVICNEASDGIYHKHIRHREQNGNVSFPSDIYICQKCFMSMYRDFTSDKVEFITQEELLKLQEDMNKELAQRTSASV